MILHFTFHYDISKLVTGLSIVGAAVALATKESLENLIASFIIFSINLLQQATWLKCRALPAMLKNRFA